MPSIASHFVMAKLVDKILCINNDDFYIGNILPDIIDLDNSHFKIKGNFYLIPDIDYFIKNYDISKNINKGYLTHLLLDKYFLEEYVPNNIKNYRKMNLFSKEMMYNDYTNLNILLVNRYCLDLDYINKILKNIDIKLDDKKYHFNIKSINYKKSNELIYIDFLKLSEFLENVSFRIAKVIKEVEK